MARLKHHDDVNAMEVTSNHLFFVVIFLICVEFGFLGVKKIKYVFQVYMYYTIKSRIDVTLICIV